MSKLKGKALAQFERDRDLAAELNEALTDIRSGKTKALRATTLTPLADGSVRRVVKNKGKIELDEILRGTRWEVLAARMKTKLSQSEFSTLLGVSKRTLENWEQGRKQPSGAAKTLLRIAAKRPDAIREALAA